MPVTAYKPPTIVYQRQDLNRYTPIDLDRYTKIVAADVPKFDQSANPEINTTIRLDGDLAHVRLPTRRLFADYRANPDAFRHLEVLPVEGETLHMVISGKYALFDLIPALIERTGQTIDDLYLVTLGFSKSNGADLCGLLDGGQVEKLSFVVSYYFKSTSPLIYDAVIPEVLQRGQRVLSMRNHAKMIVARMSDGSTYAVESSANMRSSVNVETAVMTRDKALHDFHAGWLEGLFAKALERGSHGEHQNHAAKAVRKPK